MLDELDYCMPPRIDASIARKFPHNGTLCWIGGERVANALQTERIAKHLKHLTSKPPQTGYAAKKTHDAIDAYCTALNVHLL